MGMDAGTAARTFTLLTIGDGLVSQIPALVLSTAAGFLITRVASEEAGSHLGADVGRQILAKPRALKIVALLLLGLAIVPGLPLGPFLALGLLVGFVGFSLDRGPGLREAVRRIRELRAAPEKEAAPAPSEGPLMSPVTLDVDPRISADGKVLDRAIPAVRTRLFEDLGLRLPPVRVRVGRTMAGADFAVLIREVVAVKGLVPEGMIFLGLDPGQIRDGGIEAEEARDPVTGGRGGWIDASLGPRAEAFGCRILDGVGYVTASLEEAARRRAHDLVTMQEVQDLLDTLEETSPALVRSTVPKPVDLRTLTDVCRRLVEEDVSLRHMAEILQALSRWVPVQRDVVALAELARAALARPISARHSADGEGMDAFIVSPPIEEAIRSSIHRTEQGSFLALDPEVGREIVEAARAELAHFPYSERRVPVILVQADVRRHLRKLLEIDLPRAAVLSYQEVDPAFAIRPVGEIAIGSAR